MSAPYENDLVHAMVNAFIDANEEGSSLYSPSLVVNRADQRKKVINFLVKELRTADEFSISVAFISMSGLQLLKQVFSELKERNVKGRILTTDYLCFTEPKALKTMKELWPNIEVRMYKCKYEGSFHTKGYIIRQKDIYKLIIGSSNITAGALSTNQEWNTELVSRGEGRFGSEVIAEFEALWSKGTPLDDYLAEYESIYEAQKAREAAEEKAVGPVTTAMEPNSMQVQFASRFHDLLSKGERRGLLISATGTGKTLASAFALRAENPRHVLFLAHRTQLLSQAIASYRRVMDHDRSFALLTGDSRFARTVDGAVPYESGKEYDFVFSTCEMLGKDRYLSSFDPRAFDFVVIDEVHRAGSETYRKIIEHFRPRFLLGMTATPERTDDETLIYGLFDHNVIFEIRLSDALDYDLLCPFHYYGVSDLRGIDDESYELRDFNRLYGDERLDLIIEKSRYFGYSGDRLRGLVFVSRKEDGLELSDRLNGRGYKTRFLSGEDSQKYREESIALLETEKREDGLDFLLTVDIFNEGVDIPNVNQIIMLRPTVSPIVFIQQLGRGLRKWEKKEFVVVIDFIGNYQSNYMIPLAFASGGDKEEARRSVSVSYLPGYSTIEFDEASREKIFASLSRAKIDTLQSLKREYFHLRNKINRVPSLVDFLDWSTLDPLRIVERDGSNTKSYPSFLMKIGESGIDFSEEELLCLNRLTRILMKGLRVDEAIYLETLLRGGDFASFDERLFTLYGRRLSSGEEDTIVNEFDGAFHYVKGRAKISFLSSKDKLAPGFLTLLERKEFRAAVDDLIAFSLERNKKRYAKSYRGSDFTLFERYSREDVSVLVNAFRDQTSVLFGYRYLKEGNAFPIFVNYEKSPTISPTTRYDDQFIDPQTFSWVSKSNVTLENPQIQKLIHAKENGTKVMLFVRKSDKERDERKQSYFLGYLNFGQSDYWQGEIEGLPAVYFRFKLQDEVRADIYDYLCSSEGGSKA